MTDSIVLKARLGLVELGRFKINPRPLLTPNDEGVGKELAGEGVGGEDLEGFLGVIGVMDQDGLVVGRLKGGF